MQEVHQSNAVWQLMECGVWGLGIIFGFVFGIAFSALFGMVIKVFENKKMCKPDAANKNEKLKTTAESMKGSVSCQECGMFFRCFSLN